jgi:hypothetical protein
MSRLDSNQLKDRGDTPQNFHWTKTKKVNLKPI